MPRLYSYDADEIRIFYNRNPKKDGGPPGLFGSVASALLLFLLAVLLMCIVFTLLLRGGDDLDLAGLALWLFAVILINGSLYLLPLRNLVVSNRTRSVYRGLFLRKSVGGFDEFSHVQLEGLGGAVWFSLIWKDKFRKPLRLSPMVKEEQRLAMYYHEIVPMVTECMGLPPFGEEPAGEPVTDVVVNAVEMPVPARAGPDDRNEYRYFVYDKKTGTYTGKMTVAELLAMVIFLMVLAVSGWAAFHFFDWVVQLCWGVVVAAVLGAMAKESINFRLDSRESAVISYTHFGIKRKRLPLRDLERVAYNKVFCFHLAQLFFKGDKKRAVGVVERTSMREFREALDEFSQIMGIDAEALMR